MNNLQENYQVKVHGIHNKVYRTLTELEWLISRRRMDYSIG